MLFRLFLFFWAFLLVIIGAGLGLVDATPLRPRPPGEARTVIDTRAVELLDRFDVIDEHPDGVSTRAPALPEADTACPPYPIEPVRFAANRSNPDHRGERALADSLARLEAGACVLDAAGIACSPREISIRLEGHTDDLPTARPGGNLRLSFDRALAVSALVIEGGFTVKSVEGMAATTPESPTPGRESPAGGSRHEDRRVTISLWCAES